MGSTRAVLQEAGDQKSPSGAEKPSGANCPVPEATFRVQATNSIRGFNSSHVILEAPLPVGFLTSTVHFTILDHNRIGPFLVSEQSQWNQL